MPKIAKKIPVFIQENEFQKILDVTKDEILKKIYTLGFYTGMRISEILNLRWYDIDLKRKIITVSHKIDFVTKGKKERTIPVNKTVFKLLKEFKRKNKIINLESLVFANSDGRKFNVDYISKQFKKSVFLTKLDRSIHLHSLRHSFASNLVRKGVPLNVIKELAGHESILTTQLYLHVRNDDLKKAVELLD